ncbi:MAG: zinc ribbon domain-containing protein [Candidatus Eremiobacteraeota bacterium]|nr:zinc ribbon domain-containing protein [Candidatus Eremiobacteraeota bacterium]
MPFCPACGVRVAGNATRCGLDGALLRKLECPSCHGEVSPGDRLCGHCRHSLVQQPALSSPLQMRPASWRRRLGALLFDSLAFSLIASCFFPEVSDWLWLVLLPLWASLWEAADSATPGQQVFSLKRLGPQGQSLGWRHWGGCLVAGYLPFLNRGTRLCWVPI